MANCILKFNNVAVEYYGGYNACSNVNFFIEENQIVCIFGAKDSGKTSLIKAICGLEDYSGSIIYNGKELKNIAIKDREFALTTNNLPNKKSVYKILAYPLKLRKYPKEQIDNRVFGTAKDFGISHLLQHSSSMLTLSQKTLVEIARMFVLDRKIYILDNPMENIYITERAELALEIIDKIKKLGKTVIYTTDLLQEVAMISPDKVVALCYNEMQDEGSLYSIAKTPKSLAVAKLLLQNKVCILDGAIVDGSLNIASYNAGAHNLIGEKFTGVKCLLRSDGVFLSESGIEATVVELYKDVDKATLKAQSELGIVYINTGPDTSIKSGDKIHFIIDNSKILIYDSNSEKLISR